jgi:RNA polymerase sigma-70 factor, ECF subfamily
VVHHGGVRVTGSRVEAVYREQGPRLWRALLAHSADPDIASDALAEAFAQALAHEGEIRDVAAWVWSAAFRIAGGALKERRQVGDVVHEVAYQMPEPHPDVFEALRRLSPNQRLVVLLHDYADRPASEIARTTGMSRATVYVHLSQGRRRLRRILEDDDA